MANFEITITDAGRAEIINAENTGTGPVEITEVALGSATYAPSTTQTALQAETRRLSTIAGTVVADDTIHVTIRDEGDDAYTVGEFGLYTQHGTLFAVYSQAEPILQKTASSMLLLSVDIVLGTLAAESITFGDASFANPPASLQSPGVVQLNDAIDSTRTDQAATPNAVRLALADATKHASLTRRGIVQLNDAIDSDSTDQAATPNAVRQALASALSAANGVTLDGPGTLYPGAQNRYRITNYHRWSTYTVSTDHADVSVALSGDTLYLDAATTIAPGNVTVTLTRDGAAFDHLLSIGDSTVRTPVILSPSSGATDIIPRPTLTTNAYATYPADLDPHLSTSWQVASDSAFSDLLWESLNDTAHLTSITLPDSLPAGATLWARARHTGATLGDSGWSTPVMFTTTLVELTPPSITAPANGAAGTPEMPVIEATTFGTVPAGQDGHIASSWRLRDDQGLIVWESLDDTANLTSITIPAGILQDGESTYTVEVSYRGTNLGHSDWSAPVTFTTAGFFLTTEPGSPAFGGYYVGLYNSGGNAYALILMSHADAMSLQPSSTLSYRDRRDQIRFQDVNGYTDWDMPNVTQAHLIYRVLKPTLEANDTSQGVLGAPYYLPAYTADDPEQTSQPAFQTGSSEALDRLTSSNAMQLLNDTYGENAENSLFPSLSSSEYRRFDWHTGAETVTTSTGVYPVRPVRTHFLGTWEDITGDN